VIRPAAAVLAAYVLVTVSSAPMARTTTLARTAASEPGDPAWPQWGGPHRNFAVAPRALSTTWPAGGPRRLWQRALGDGYSAIVSDGPTLYTVYRQGERDVIVALDAQTGTTRWETAVMAPFVETCSQRLGPVPRAAPLVDGDRLVTVSAGGQMNSFERASGTRVWSRELLEASPDAVRACGFSSSPLAWRRLIVTTAGGKGRGVVALDAATGATRWQAQDFENGYSSPIVVDVGGSPELIVFTYAEIAGLDPATGALEWTRPHPADQGVNVATPVWGPDHLLFVSSAYNGGSRVLRLTRTASGVTAEEVWSNKRVRVHFGNAVRIGSRVYASNGDFGAAPVAAIDVNSGEMIWRDRTLGRSTLVAAGDTLIILDEDGNLAIASPGDKGLTVHAKAQVLGSPAWTAPTLVGTRLYLRDRTQIVALELGGR
jgi:outer membrane protein assembly factor BamB